MNIEAWKKLRKTIAESEMELDMSVWGSCGTAACLAGFACSMEGMLLSHMRTIEIERTAAKILGLNSILMQGDGHHVFMGGWSKSRFSLNNITREEALEYLDLAIAEQNPMVTL